MKETPFKDLKTNPFSCFGEDWMALTSGNQTDGYDAMTVARGAFGVNLGARQTSKLPADGDVLCLPQLLHQDVYGQRKAYFLLSHFDASRKKALAYLGRITFKWLCRGIMSD